MYLFYRQSTYTIYAIYKTCMHSEFIIGGEKLHTI